jgi:hypothetical protein
VRGVLDRRRRLALRARRFLGTSVEQIDRTYGHLLPDSIDRTSAALDAFAARAETEAETFGY